MAKRVIVVGVASAAIVVAGCIGCSDKKSNQGQGGQPGQPAAPAGPVLIIDGKKQDVAGAVTCTPVGDNVNIGIGDVSSGIGAVVSNADPPIVHSVGLGNFDNIALGFSDAAPDQATNAGAVKKDKSYAIKGTASGVDMSNPDQPQTVTKSFEMQVTCP
ncbi:lipoprotein LpqH [Mycobacterium bourgelatii]|uniref:Lipoprotein LpqH n=1 Tax=Mycobacterium bourgelatii TaxID=1273442 RepID=A0A7I9YWT0_MYCBU|nr:lipoprotein LpqH [Mycobacterium bourgelatii]MCV6978283.1 lipoprotein LpqH [Mycobacterium bourgelatii]GFG93032.1 lipoprotein LpqH [Mycobacterium bourgelatii]